MFFDDFILNGITTFKFALEVFFIILAFFLSLIVQIHRSKDLIDTFKRKKTKKKMYIQVECLTYFHACFNVDKKADLN